MSFLLLPSKTYNMKRSIAGLLGIILVSACSFNTEVNRNNDAAIEADIQLLMDGDFKTLYKDVSVEMKSYVDEDIFLDILELQTKVSGKFVEANQSGKDMGKYKSETTTIYTYDLMNEEGDAFTYTAEYLRGHLLKQFIEEPDWREEPEFVKSISGPIRNLVAEKDFGKIFQLLEGKYPIDQVESLVMRIANSLENLPSRYLYHWTDNDSDNNMLVAFVYAYEGQGYLEYRFFIKEDYPLAGIFFNPDTSVKLPQS